MTITIDAIKAEHSKVAEMIAAFEKQSLTTSHHVKATTITLAAGEKYAGLILGDAGEPDHHLILLAGEVDDTNWEDAGKWAEAQGGVLPTRSEQSLLFANLKGEFRSSYYWSSQQHESNSGWAWYQDFDSGYQHDDDTYHKLRARAVRRLIIL